MTIIGIPLQRQSKDDMNWKIITWYIGISLLFVAVLMTISGIVAIFTPDDDSRIPLLYSALLTGTVGSYPLIFIKRGYHRLSFREGNGIVVGAWTMACLFGTFPFLFYGGEFHAASFSFITFS